MTNIQRFSVHDGPGIRTTIFFKGCPLRCRWCHNPETQSFRKELLYYKERCVNCQVCLAVCAEKAIKIKKEGEGYIRTDRKNCVCCGRCGEACVSNARQFSGHEYSVAELVEIVRKDQMFYEESGGGATLSGGEVMAQNMDFVETLMQALTDAGCSVRVDTCGFAPWESFQRILNLTDAFLYDVKCIDRKRHIDFTGQDNALILENLERLQEQNVCINIRIPIIPGFNADTQSIRGIAAYVGHRFAENQVNLLPYHRIGISKGDRLEQNSLQERFTVPDEERMQEYAGIFCDYGIKHVLIGG